MSNKILGKDVIVAMLISGSYYPVFCGKTAILNIEQDEIETTSINSPSAREFVPGLASATLDVTGVSILNNSENRISNLYLMQQAIRRVVQSIRMLFTDLSGNQVGVTFSAFFRNGSENRDVTQWGQSSVSFRVTGEITFSTIIAPPVTPACEEEDPIFDALAEGSADYTNSLLIQVVGQTLTILGVTRAGFTYYETSGTPGNLEFKYDSTLGKINFRDAGNPGGEPISINYKIET